MNNADLSFSKGLNVITGETGAGKSVLLEAIKLLLGKKPKSNPALNKEKTAKIQAVFSLKGNKPLQDLLEERGFENEDDPEKLLISRTFKEDGKGNILVNSILGNMALLKDIGEGLVEIHGQNEHQTMLKTDTQRLLLDKFCGKEHENNLEKLKDLHKDRKTLAAKLEELESNLEASERRANEIKDILDELNYLNIEDQNEEDELKSELNKLANAENIIEKLAESYNLLSGTDDSPSLVSMLHRISSNFSAISAYRNDFTDLSEKISDMYYELKSVESDLSSELDSLQSDPQRLDWIQSRLMELSRAQRKYHTDFLGLIKMNQELSEELYELERPDAAKKKLQEKFDKINEQFLKTAALVTSERKKSGKTLEKTVSSEMSKLGFNQAKFYIDFKTVEPTAKGNETAEFCVSLNPGSPGGPLKKIASGGELSRVALAIKTVLAACDNLPTLVFDEIDAGIGGQTAEAVAESLKTLSDDKQVILVTHLHQIAKEGDKHFTVTKSVSNNETEVCIAEVKDAERAEEIARMLGSLDSKTIEFAKTMLN
ncbi:MAG: DNA repair protein RecN [Candidatus Riflebacteria bacterium]|nr:DNA repair protein RecN [Candidatus Riflebacteria bacterium]